MTEAEKKVARQKDNERKKAARIRAEAARIAQEIEKNAENPFQKPSISS